VKFFRDRWVSAAKYHELVETVGQLELDFAAAEKEYAGLREDNARLKLENEELKTANDAAQAQIAQDAATIAQLRLALGDAVVEAR
jgi:regulator of replication initiation timing